MNQSIGVPSTKSMGSAFGDYGAGFAGGAIYGGVKSLLGDGLIASLGAPVLAGSVIKGARGTAIATIAGFFAGAELFRGGIGALFGGGGSQNTRGVM